MGRGKKGKLYDARKGLCFFNTLRKEPGGEKIDIPNPLPDIFGSLFFILFLFLYSFLKDGVGGL